MDGGAWWATVHGVARNRTRLSDFTLSPSIVSFGARNGIPLQCSCLKNLMDGGPGGLLSVGLDMTKQ